VTFNILIYLRIKKREIGKCKNEEIKIVFEGKFLKYGPISR